MTVYQKCYVSVKLTEIGENDFEVIDGSTSKMKRYVSKIIGKKILLKFLNGL